MRYCLAHSTELNNAFGMIRDLRSWLEDNGLGKYAEVFAENDIDLDTLPLITEEDLKELGLSLGHRRRLMAAVMDMARGAETPDLATLQEDPTPGETSSATPAQRQEAERRHLSVLFSDLVGSTELANRLDPEEMRDVLRRYQDAAAGAATRFGGHVAKYLGDGLLVYFGWPTAFEDHAERAVRAGLEIISAVSRIQIDPENDLQVRVGIASGPVVIGDLVGDHAMEAAAVTGPTPNLAARLQAEARPGGLVISDQTGELVGSGFELGPPLRGLLKGFDEEKTYFEVAGQRQISSRFEAARGKPRGPLVGRQNEYGLLTEAWTRARKGKGEIVLLSGEAGIGKSRLTENLVSEAEGEGAPVWRMQCSPYFSTSSFHPLIELLARKAGIGPDEDDEARLERLKAFVGPVDSSSGRARLQQAAALLAPGAAESADTLRLPPQEQKEASLRFLAGEITSKCASQPLLLVLEDAHWIDPSTLETLERIVARSSDLPLLLIVTHRPEWNCRWVDDYTNVKIMRLARLERDQVAALVATIMGEEPAEDLVDMITDRTDGVPLFVEELARASKESDRSDMNAIPPTLEGALLARLDQLSAPARQTAQVASVIGREFQPDVLAAAMGVAREEALEALTELRRAGVVFESGLSADVFAFRHALVQDAAYASMITETRRRRHLATAQALLRKRGAEADREPELVAKHFEEAADHDSALKYWRIATEKALGRAAGPEAIEHAKAAQRAAGEAAGDRVGNALEADILLGRSLENVGRLPQALNIYGSVAAQAREAGRPTQFINAALNFADCAVMADATIELARDLCLEALEMTHQGDERMRCRLLSMLARCNLLLGEFEKSAAYSRKATALAEKLDDTKAQFALLTTRFTAPVIAREPVEIETWQHRLEKMFEFAADLDDHDRGRERAIGFYVSAEMGDRDRMEECLERLAEVGEARQHMHLQWVETHGRAMKAILDGDFRSAERFAEEGLKIGRQTHGTHVEGVYGVQMFTIRREQARLQEVAAVFKRLLDENPEDVTWKPGFALIAAELGYLDPARRMLNEIAEEGFKLPLDAMYSTTLGYLAEVAVSLDNDDHAPRIYSLLEAYADMTITAGVTTVCTGAAARRLGSLAGVLGDWELAEHHFETALTIDRDMRAAPWEAHSQFEYARMLSRRGRAKDAGRIKNLQGEAGKTALRFDMDALRSKLDSKVE